MRIARQRTATGRHARTRWRRFASRAVEPDDRGGSTQHPASLNVKTARPPRGILPFTHLAREGRMTVTIGRRELLAALGGAATRSPASPAAARAPRAATQPRRR